MSVDNRLPTNQSQLDIASKLDDVKTAIENINIGGSTTFSGLSDVSITSPTDGQIPKFNVTTQKWENADESGGTTVVANPSGTATTDLTKLQVGNEIYGIPSGGSGGHTILDDDGTALVQEDNLQFNGVYSTDNSTDGVTEVNVYREMTKAEFDLLSDDEKKGFIKTTDEPDIASIVDGVFIDTNNVIVQPTSYTPSTFSYTATEDCALYIEIPCKGGFSTFLQIDGVNTQGFNVAGSNTTNYGIVTVLLKKGQVATLSATEFPSVTPDYAVYGIQQGSKTVDYHEYSTEEKVVGKWIDGNTLYERCFEFSSDLLVPYDSYVTTNISDNSYKQLVDCTGFYTPSGAMYKLFGYFDSGVLKLQTARNITSDTINKVWIQYTKSS